MIQLLYRVYQLLIAVPVTILMTIWTAFIVCVGCTLGDGHYWGYYPGRWWARVITKIFLLPVKVEGGEALDEHQSYVFVSNHQGAFDIFLIYGFLNRNFKWMMKKAIRKIPLVGVACEYAHHIFLDKSGPKKIRKSYEQAESVLKEGMSLVVFPEGARTFTGHMGVFRRGAFMLADELQLPVCPLTINGSFNIKPRMKDLFWVFWHPMKLTIHEPIEPIGKGTDNIKNQMDKSYEVIMSALEPKYQGFVENPDQ
jgi:1-acyl-sn-glycerol-3-phosphate acyltransferase